MIIKMDDLKLNTVAYCNRGTREFFKRHNLDWNKFRKEGLDESEFIKTGDAMAIHLVSQAKLKEGVL